MEFRELRSLAVLAESGCITRTGGTLHLSPAAIHKQIKNLENEFGVRLYEKVGRRLRLTQVAELLLPHLKLLLAQHEALVSAVEEWKGLRKGRVRIGSGPTLSSCMVPPLLRSFRRRYPAIDLLVETGNSATLLENLDKGALDLALLIWPEHLDNGNCVVARLWPFEIVIVSNRRHTPTSCSFAQLQRLPFILFKKGSRVEDLIDRYFAELHFKANVIMRFDNADAIKAMIRTGLGISMLPFWTVYQDIREGRLSLIHQHECPLVSNIALVSRKHSYESKPVTAFIRLAQGFESRTLRLTSHAVSASVRARSK